MCKKIGERKGCEETQCLQTAGSSGQWHVTHTRRWLQQQRARLASTGRADPAAVRPLKNHKGLKIEKGEKIPQNLKERIRPPAQSCLKSEVFWASHSSTWFPKDA